MILVYECIYSCGPVLTVSTLTLIQYLVTTHYLSSVATSISSYEGLALLVEKIVRATVQK